MFVQKIDLLCDYMVYGLNFGIFMNGQVIFLYMESCMVRLGFSKCNKNK